MDEDVADALLPDLVHTGVHLRLGLGGLVGGRSVVDRDVGAVPERIAPRSPVRCRRSRPVTRRFLPSRARAPARPPRGSTRGRLTATLQARAVRSRGPRRTRCATSPPRRLPPGRAATGGAGSRAPEEPSRECPRRSPVRQKCLRLGSRRATASQRRSTRRRGRRRASSGSRAVRVTRCASLSPV